MRGVSERTVQRHWDKARIVPLPRDPQTLTPALSISTANAGAPSALIFDRALEMERRPSARQWLDDPARARIPALAADVAGAARRARRHRTARTFSRPLRRSRRLGDAGRPDVRRLHARLADRPGRHGQRLARAAERRPLRGRGGGQAPERRAGRPCGRGALPARGHDPRAARHPHIAHLVDAGVSPSGQPYLVLEHVEGEPIDRYCDEPRPRRRGASAASSSTSSRRSPTPTPT